MALLLAGGEVDPPHIELDGRRVGCTQEHVTGVKHAAHLRIAVRPVGHGDDAVIAEVQDGGVSFFSIGGDRAEGPAASLATSVSRSLMPFTGTRA